MRLLLLCLLAAVALSICTCAGPEAPSTMGLPSLVTLERHQTAATEQLALDGNATFQRSPGAADVATSLLLDAGLGEMEWAIWSFTPTPGKALHTVTVNLNSAGTDAAWLALADFATGKWVLSGPFVDPQTLDLAVLPDVLSPSGHVYVAVVATDGNSAIIDGLTLEQDGNVLPVASFTATPEIGAPGDPVALDASASSDLDGIIVNYEWDLDGDGSYEVSAQEATLDTTLPFPAGTVSVGLQVTDDAGGTGTTTLDLHSDGDVWQYVDVAAELGLHPSLAEINGAPAIAYHHQNNLTLEYSLKYAHTAQADGLAGWATATVFNVDGERNGSFCSLALIAGKPAISYVQSVGLEDRLRYAHNAAADGSGNWSIVPVPSNGSSMHTSLSARPDGTPGIAYYSYGGEDLDYAGSFQPDGSSDWNSAIVESSGVETGMYASQEMVGGNTCISYCNTGGLIFRRKLLVGGWERQIIDSEPSGYYSSLAELASGNPAIAYYDYGLNQLEYVWADNGGTDDDWHVVEVATDGDMDGYSCSLAVIQGIPMICYFSSTGSEFQLKLAIANDANGTSWITSTIDTIGGVYITEFTSLAEIDGRPAVAYYNDTLGVLRYAMLFQDQT